jgi:hypothetical protein
MCIVPFTKAENPLQAGFSVDFSADSALNPNLQIATWSNGLPFGSAFCKDRVKIDNHALSLGVWWKTRQKR